MPLPSGLRAAGDLLSNAGYSPDVATGELTVNTRPRDAFEEVDRLGQNGDIITGSAWTGDTVVTILSSNQQWMLVTD